MHHSLLRNSELFPKSYDCPFLLWIHYSISVIRLWQYVPNIYNYLQNLKCNTIIFGSHWINRCLELIKIRHEKELKFILYERRVIYSEMYVFWGWNNWWKKYHQSSNIFRGMHTLLRKCCRKCSHLHWIDTFSIDWTFFC